MSSASYVFLDEGCKVLVAVTSKSKDHTEQTNNWNNKILINILVFLINFIRPFVSKVKNFNDFPLLTLTGIVIIVMN